MRFVIDVEPLPKKDPGRNRKTGATWNPRQKYIDEIRSQIRNFWGIEEGEEEDEFYEPPFKKGTPIILRVDFVTDRPKRMMRQKDPDGLIWHSDVKAKDLDNLLKPFQDAVNKILWYDDSQVCNLSGRKFYREKRGKPRISASIQQLNFTPQFTVGEAWGKALEQGWTDTDRPLQAHEKKRLLTLQSLNAKAISTMDEQEAKEYLTFITRLLRGE